MFFCLNEQDKLATIKDRWFLLFIKGVIFSQLLFLFWSCGGILQIQILTSHLLRTLSCQICLLLHTGKAQNIAFLAPQAAFQISSLPVHSTSFSPVLFQHENWCVMNSEWYTLLHVNWWILFHPDMTFRGDRALFIRPLTITTLESNS